MNVLAFGRKAGNLLAQRTKTQHAFVSKYIASVYGTKCKSQNSIDSPISIIAEEGHILEARFKSPNLVCLNDCNE